MKNKIHGLGRSLTAVALMLCMLLSVFAPTVMASAESENKTELCSAVGTSLKEKVTEAYEECNVEDKIYESLDNLWNLLEDRAEDTRSEVGEMLAEIAEYTGINELVALYGQLELLRGKLEAATTSAQRARLEKKTCELITRLQEIAAMTTATDLQPDYYVSIGDSTLTGYGLDDYVPGANNGEGQVLGTEAPVLLAQRLFGEDYKDHFKKLDKGGLRIDDLLVWLGEEEYIDDFYTRYTMDANAVESETAFYQYLFETEIKKADLITLALGGGNVSTFLGQQIKQMSKGEPIYEMDWTRYYPDADLTDIRKCIESVQTLLDGMLPEIKGVPAEKLAPVVAESFLFGLVGYINNYSKVVDRIHEINPDARIVIVSFFNFADDMEIPVSIGEKTVNIPLGRMIDLLMDSCNASSLAYAVENSDYATYVSISDTTTILDEQGLYDWESRLNGMATQTWLTHAGPEGHVYIADRIYDAITNEYTDKEIALEVLKAFADYTVYLANEFGNATVYAGVSDFVEFVNIQIEKFEELIKAETAKFEEKIVELEAKVSEKKAELETAAEAVKTEIEQKKSEICALIAEKKAAAEEIASSVDKFFASIKK